MAPRKQHSKAFYAGASTAWIERSLEGFAPPRLDGLPLAGVVPHAGWDYSGAVAAKVFKTIREYREPGTFVIFGTVHRHIPENAVYARGSWLTPFGDVKIDETLADQIIARGEGLLERNELAHDYEHSIEVQMPFLRHFFPAAKAVPIMVLPDDRAPALGMRVAELFERDKPDAVIIGTTDLTHYGEAYSFTRSGYGARALEWMKRNDARIIELAVRLEAEKIVAEASVNLNACGAGAMAATIAAARGLGCKMGRVIEYKTSYDVMPEDEFRMAVGYVGIVFCGS